jgi:hypothetical protein
MPLCERSNGTNLDVFMEVSCYEENISMARGKPQQTE